jgi:putative sugar O-methyltransferase
MKGFFMTLFDKASPQFYRLFLCIFFTYNNIFSSELSPKFVVSAKRSQDLWHHMQKLYNQCMTNGEKNNALMNKWCHDFWASTRNQLAQIVRRSHVVNFLGESSIAAAMVRGEFGVPQMFEEIYLDSCISNYTKNIISKTSDTTFGNLPRTSSKFNCSTSNLGHLFYLAKVIEYASKGGHQPVNIGSVLEIGGGYGNLARLFKQALPDVTLILIDLPEMVALQWFFLRCTLPNVKVVFHTDSQKGIVLNAINLIPLNLLNDFSLKTDVFVSTFALSECSTNFQEYIAQKRFFEASLCYVNGQLNGLGNWAQHSTVFKSLYTLYSDVICQPFHMVSLHLKCYELIAHN